MSGVLDRVAIVGAGCCKFGENWDKSSYDMIVDATIEALQDAKLELKDIQAAWVGCERELGATLHVSNALKLKGVPITRCENACATGMDAFRNAAFAVACGMYDTVLVVGYEKLKDLPTRGLPPPTAGTGGHPIILRGSGGPPNFGLLATRYMDKYGIDRTPMAKVAVKNHHNGSLTAKAHLRNEITLEQALNAPLVAWPLGVFDCCGLTDGAAAAIITRKELAKRFRDDYVVIRGIGLSVSSVPPQYRSGYEYDGFPETVEAARQAYEQAGITNPRKEIDFAEVHDCFTITEIINYEDLQFCKRGEGWRMIVDGITNLDGELPVNMDGGLKCFGHPIGASGLRMIYEVYKQLQGKCGVRQVKKAEVGLAHNIGGPPQVASVVVMSTP
ncbi:MAG: acetyl-CoA acetyltransferase [Chloroflexota bacterium]|nr:MAG: acetyl-CoA acetyltransferase [Chloroflexota bacterium]